MKKLFYDIETTGVKYWKNGIHQIAGILEIDGEVQEEFNIKVQPNPKCVIEDEALKVGGITREDLKNYIPFHTGYNTFKNRLNPYIDTYDKKDKIYLVGYNNRHFDDQFLRAFFKQNLDNYFGSYFWSDSHDVMVLASKHLQNERINMENFKLITVARQLGIEVDEEKTHDALYDIRITKEIYDKL